MIKVYTIPGKEDAACVRLANGQYHSLQPNPDRDDAEADAFQESFDDHLPECFSESTFQVMSEDDALQRFPEIDFGIRSEDLGAMPSMGPPIERLAEAAAILREEATAVEAMHRQGWHFDGVEEGWCSATTAVATEPNGRVKVYVLPEDDAAAAVKLATGQYHILRPRTAEDAGLIADTSSQELDELWEQVKVKHETDARRQDIISDPDEGEFRYVEAVEDTLPPPFSEKHTLMLRLQDLQQDYDAAFGTDSFNYGEAIDFEGCENLVDVANRLRAKAQELEELEARGWEVESVEGQILHARVDVEAVAP